MNRHRTERSTSIGSCPESTEQHFIIGGLSGTAAQVQHIGI
jgi:hypothetical protein